MRYSILVVVLLTITSILFSQSKLDSLVSAGNEQSFQFQFKQAERTFQTLIKLYPNSSLGYYFISRNSLWFYLANKDSVSRESYLRNSKFAESKAKAEYKKYPEDVTVNYNLGNIFFLKSIYNSTEQNTMDAFWATKSAVNYFEDAIEYNPNYFEPYLPLGIIKYALGFVPGVLNWAITIAGLDGDKNEGLSDIRTAFHSCLNCKTEAAYHLGKLYTEYNAMYDSAEVLLSNIVDKFPKNELFLYQYAILQIDKRELGKAINILDRILLSNSQPKFLQTYVLSKFLKGEILFKQNKFSEAITEYEEFISQTITYDYTGVANLKIALAYEMLDEKLLAQRHYILARNGNHDIPDDYFANEKSKELFEVKFTKNDKLFIEAQNFLESGKYLDVLATAKKIDTLKVDSEKNFDIALLQIESYQKLNNSDEASKIFSKWDENSELDDYKNYVKFLYLEAKQNYNDGKYSKAKIKLELAFDSIKKNNNKLHRLLVNLSTKLMQNNK